MLADRVADPVGVAAGRDDRVSRGEGRLRDVDAHATAGAGDEPHVWSVVLLLSVMFLCAFR